VPEFYTIFATQIFSRFFFLGAGGGQIFPAPTPTLIAPVSTLACILYLIGVESPKLELLFKERTTHVGRVVQLASPVVVEYLREDARMPVEEILVEYRVVVGERLGEPGQPRGRDLLECRLVRFVTDATHVNYDAVVGVRHAGRRRRAPGPASVQATRGAGIGGRDLQKDAAAAVARGTRRTLSSIVDLHR